MNELAIRVSRVTSWSQEQCFQLLLELQNHVEGHELEEKAINYINAVEVLRPEEDL